MLTFADAAQDGYTFTDGDGVCEVAGHGQNCAVYSDIPRFMALVQVAEWVGDDLATTPVTANLVAQVSGETYVDPPPPPPPDPDLGTVDVGRVAAAAGAAVGAVLPVVWIATEQQIADAVAAATAAAIAALTPPA